MVILILVNNSNYLAKVDIQFLYGIVGSIRCSSATHRLIAIGDLQNFIILVYHPSRNDCVGYDAIGCIHKPSSRSIEHSPTYSVRSVSCMWALENIFKKLIIWIFFLNYFEFDIFRGRFSCPRFSNGTNVTAVSPWWRRGGGGGRRKRWKRSSPPGNAPEQKGHHTPLSTTTPNITLLILDGDVAAFDLSFIR